MTSETEAIKTNEFLRRRKLRLQQVREQSKDIAKKIRQRAKVEKLRQVVDLDAKKQKEYFECQEKLVKRLEVLYARGLEKVGASHQSASERTQQDEVIKTDLSKVRGKEAAAELRKKRQEILDQQKKLLDRKLHAREAANEISRDKSSVVANKLSKPTKVSDDAANKPESSTELTDTKKTQLKDAEHTVTESEAVKKSDMATQWDMENIPNEWEPAVPALSLPTDKDTPKVSDDHPVSGKSTVTNDKAKTTQEHTLHRKSSVLMYNHSTRDSRDLPCNDKIVVRDLQSEEDAYSQAVKELSTVTSKDKEHQRKVQDLRNRVAVTKHSVEKEYKDTMNFLNSLPKDKGNKVIKSAYMDERRQQMQQESRQQKMQQEYKKIEKECRRHHCANKSRSKSKSPTRHDTEDTFDSKDFQYSWMPVPESDGNLAIHAIPNTVRQGKSGNSVKFSKVDSYHEYRSRHKHTPPTKDTAHEKLPNKKVVKAVVIDRDTSESSDTSSLTSDTSSVENLRVDRDPKYKNVKEINKNLSDAERIIIYQVLDSRTNKKSKRQTKLLNEIAKSLTCIEKVQKPISEDDSEQTKKQQAKNVRSISKSADNAVSFEQLNEGVYKVVEEQGDNIASMYFRDHEKAPDAQSTATENKSCQCKKSSKDQLREKSAILHWESGDCIQPPKITSECQCDTADKKKASPSLPPKQFSNAPSTSSFITATNDKVTASEGGYIKLVDETGQEAGKFFIGASGFLNDNHAYEVVIQLRKKDGVKEDKVHHDKQVLQQNKQPISEINNNEKEPLTSSETDANDVNPPSDVDIREVLAYRSVTNTESHIISPQRPQNNIENIEVVSEAVMTCKNMKDRSDTNTESSDGIRLIQSTSEKKEMCDKGVHTLLTNVTQSNPVSRPATTTYTQTSLSSPVQRPVFFHMSSSTSTAYMSPPEMILPKFLRHDYGMTEDEIYDPIQTIEMTEKKYCENYAGCTCIKCTHARKVTLNKANVPGHCRKNKCDNKKLRTPPNTARSPTGHRCALYDNLQEGKADDACKSEKTTKTKCKNHNCGNVDTVKRHCHRNKKSSTENIRVSRNVNMHVGLNLTSQTKYKTSSSSHDRKLTVKSNLNPIIKDYVKKLLALNREGLKAVEVGDQECSSVGTPGSSIINVPYNVDESKAPLENTLSLEQIRNVLKRQIMEENTTNNCNYTKNPNHNLKHSSSRTYRRKPVHKVKSLNISKHLLNKNKSGEVKSKNPVSLSSTDENIKSQAPSIPTKRSRSKSSPTPRQAFKSFPRFNDSTSTAKNSTGTEKAYEYYNRSVITTKTKSVSPPAPVLRNPPELDPSADSESTGEFEVYKPNVDIPVSMSTQTSQNIDSDSNFMKMAEDKLHNMEKIADLTEKCTKRLSNLAKVLEEVRKNKSLAYSQISSAESIDSQSEHKSDKESVSTVQIDSTNIPPRLETKSPDLGPDKEINIENEKLQAEYLSVLIDIPKPVFKVPEPNVPPHPKTADKLDSPLHLNANTTDLLVRTRQKPPPALSRINLKHGHEYIIPHELSTVIEVDSPMSMKHKSHSLRNDARDIPNSSKGSSPGNKELVEVTNKNDVVKDQESSVNPDLLQNNTNFSKKFKFSSTESSDDSKFQMIDLKQFNEIMLEPFISIQEYAKQYNMEPPDEGSNLEDVHKEDVINDDMSSLHSDGSLPDVIAELLKRNIITEPFKFDTASNINSTTVSSESTLSMLALSKARRDRKRSNVVFHTKENIAETSDTLSISSNPDLENAFKRLGMGWASSTLKKTKERLALSSSSNTSSSSISQYKTKSFNQDIPALVTDSVSTQLNFSKKDMQNAPDNSKNVEQQTTLSNSMTVKEFLRNELSKKITFNNRSSINDTQEFVSLFETKIPEEMKETSQVTRDEHSIDSGPSGANRARTSTPVQIFKSMTYRSTSSSNVSNGLFSNADDLSSVKMTSNSMKNHSTSDKDDLTIPNFSLRLKKSSDCSKSD